MLRGTMSPIATAPLWHRDLSVPLWTSPNPPVHDLGAVADELGSRQLLGWRPDLPVSVRRNYGLGARTRGLVGGHAHCRQCCLRHRAIRQWQQFTGDPDGVQGGGGKVGARDVSIVLKVGNNDFQPEPAPYLAQFAAEVDRRSDGRVNV